MASALTDPPGNPVAQHRPADSAGPGRQQAGVGGAQNAAQGDKQKKARHQEGQADKGLHEGDGKGQRKGPIGIGPRGGGYEFNDLCNPYVEHEPTHCFMGLDRGAAVPRASYIVCSLAYALCRDTFDKFLPYGAAISVVAR